jgi:hypothetical protein
MRRHRRNFHVAGHAHVRTFFERLRGGRLERLFWQSGGGYDRKVTEQAALAMLDYRHGNLVRKGLVTSPRDWKWSRAAWFVDQSPVPLTPESDPARVVPGCEIRALRPIRATGAITSAMDRPSIVLAKLYFAQSVLGAPATPPPP